MSDQPETPSRGAPADADGTEESPEEKLPVTPPPPEVQQVLNALPPEQRQVLERSFAMLVQSPMMNPIAAKINKDHLNKIFDGIENDNRRMYEDQSEERKHLTTRTIVGIAAFLIACGLFLYFDKVPLLKEILVYLVLIGGGAGLGARFLREKE